MFRKFLAGLTAIVAALATISLLQAAGHALFPPPPGVDMRDIEVAREWLPKLPLGGFISVLVSYFAGSFTGAIVGGWLAGGSGKGYAILIGSIVFMATIANLVMIPVHPVWFSVTALVGIPVFAYLGGRLAPQRRYE